MLKTVTVNRLSDVPELMRLWNNVLTARLNGEPDNETLILPVPQPDGSTKDMLFIDMKAINNTTIEVTGKLV